MLCASTTGGIFGRQDLAKHLILFRYEFIVLQRKVRKTGRGRLGNADMRANMQKKVKQADRPDSVTTRWRTFAL